MVWLTEPYTIYKCINIISILIQYECHIEKILYMNFYRKEMPYGYMHVVG